MHRRRNQLTIATVMFVLGLLVVIQLRTQASGTAFAGLSAQDLTVLVANLNARNDQLRREAANLQRELATLTANADRGDASLDELEADLERVRLYAGLEPASGQGVVVLIRGPADAPAVDGLLNELRNAGAEAMAVDGTRVTPGLVIVGSPGDVTIDADPAEDPIEIDAIGPPDKLTGSLTRSGGIIAQLAATLPDVIVEVTPVDTVVVPATDRSLVPSSGRPRL